MKKFILDKLETPENIAEYGNCIIKKLENLDLIVWNEVYEVYHINSTIPSVIQNAVEYSCLGIILQ